MMSCPKWKNNPVFQGDFVMIWWSLFQENRIGQNKSKRKTKENMDEGKRQDINSRGLNDGILINRNEQKIIICVSDLV